MHVAATSSHNTASSVLAILHIDFRVRFPIAPTIQSTSMLLVNYKNVTVAVGVGTSGPAPFAFSTARELVKGIATANLIEYAECLVPFARRSPRSRWECPKRVDSKKTILSARRLSRPHGEVIVTFDNFVSRASRQIHAILDLGSSLFVRGRMFAPDDPNDPKDPSADIEFPSSTENPETLFTSDSSAPAPSYTAAPKTIGPYRLVRKLGEGGMGQVWLAEQTAPLQRLVAIKLVRTGVSNTALLARFESERQALARMNHPAIAKVYDAGTTPDGLPYFVMEYVPGVPITVYCDQKRLSIRQRIELFTQVCEGVQHAHQKALIHRDLKPQNILVTDIDGKPTPRIIDFGIAKAVAERDSLATMVTREGNFVGTPAYMSPEQADPEIRDIDTRSDVYSLAVILYELLTGALPFDPTEWRSEVIDEALRRLREQDPPLPSIQFRKLAITESKTATNAAHLRSTEPQQLVTTLRGDLDWITMKALERDRARRYGTPNELAADLHHFLANEPVAARPASAVYRFQKYARRHRVGVSVAAAALGLLVAFGVMQTIQIRRVTAERDHTARERDRANRIAQFMIKMFKVSQPSEARGNSITAREVLDKASTDIDAGLTKDPELQARLMYTMGNVFLSLGLDSRAQSLFERALDIQRRVLGPENPDTLQTATSLANSLRFQGHLPESEKLHLQTLEIQRRVLGPQHPDTLDSGGDYAATLFAEGRYPEAEKLQRENLDIRRRSFGPQDPDTLMAMRDLSSTLRREGHFTDAEKLQREALDVQRRTLGPDHPDTLTTMTSLANTEFKQAHFSEAESLYRDVLDSRHRILGPEHPDTLTAMGNLANALSSEGHFPEAEKLQRESLAIKTRVLGAEHPDTLREMENLSFTLGNDNRFADAEKLQRQVIAIGSRVLGPDHPDVLETMNGLAGNLQREGRYTEAEKLERQTLDTERRLLGPDKAETLEAMNNLGNTLQSEGHYAEAEKLQRETLVIVISVFGPTHPNTLSVMTNLAETLEKEDHYPEAEKLQRQTLDNVRSLFGPEAPQTLDALQSLAICLSYEKRYDEAKPLFDQTVQIASRLKLPDGVLAAQYAYSTGAALAGHPDEALDHLRQAIEAGYNDANHMAHDPLLKSLHGNDQFNALLVEAGKRSTPPSKKPI
jgi:eukaryotic-like serine/threonine-protein kinase